MVGMFLTNTHIDDGWMLLFHLGDEKLGELTAVDPATSPLPAMHPWYLLLELAPVDRFGPTALWMVPVLVTTAMWAVLYGAITRLGLPKVSVTVIGAAVFVVLVTLPFMLTLRPDGLMMFGIAVCLMASLRYADRYQPWWLGVAFVAASLASATHPLAFIAFTFPALALISVFREARPQLIHRITRRDAIALGFIAAAVVAGVALVLWGRSPSEVVTEYLDSRKVIGGHEIPWHEEWRRYDFAIVGNAGHGLLTMSLIAAGCLMLVAYRSAFPSRQRFVLLGGMLISFAWLIAFPDKIHAQFSLMALFAMFGWLSLAVLDRSKVKLVTQILCGVMIFSVLVYPGGLEMTTGLYDVTGSHWLVRVGIFTFAVVLLAISRFRGRDLMIPALIGLLAVSAAGHFRMTPLLTNKEAGWSKYNMLMGKVSAKENPKMAGLSPFFAALGDRGTVMQDTIFPMAYLKPRQIWTSMDNDPPSYYLGSTTWVGYVSLPDGTSRRGKLMWKLSSETQEMGIYKLGKPCKRPECT